MPIIKEETKEVIPKLYYLLFIFMRHTFQTGVYFFYILPLYLLLFSKREKPSINLNGKKLLHVKSKNFPLYYINYRV